jgi:RNA polymerase sporulation-specific sigma factor
MTDNINIELNEINELIIRVRAHDDEAFAVLEAKHLGILKKSVSSFSYIKSVSEDELMSVAREGLFNAAMHFRFDDKSGASFSTYAKKCVHNKLLTYIATIPQLDLADVDVDNVAVSGGIENSIIRRENVKALLDMVARMSSEYEYEVFRLHILGDTTASIAKKLGKSAKSIDNAKARLFKRIRENREDFLDI